MTTDSSGVNPSQQAQTQRVATTDTDTDNMSNAELFAACAQQSMDNQNSIMMGLAQIGNIINKGISYLNNIMTQLTNLANNSLKHSNNDQSISPTLQSELSNLGINLGSSANASEIQGAITSISNDQQALATQAQKTTTLLNNNYGYENKIISFVSNTISGQKSVVDQITSNL